MNVGALANAVVARIRAGATACDAQGGDSQPGKMNSTAKEKAELVARRGAAVDG